jgi:hypothetical protein
MKYKESARSPRYGRIFSYDENGRELNELDILKIKLIHNESETTIGALLTLLRDYEKALKSIPELTEQIAAQRAQIELLNKLVVLLEAQINIQNL